MQNSPHRELYSMDFTEDLDHNLVWQIDNHRLFNYHLWEPQEALVVLGRSNIAAAEIYIDRCSRENIKIARRRGGGGAVLLNKGMLVISIAKLLKTPRNPSKCFWQINQLLIETLRNNHVEHLSQMGVSDICIGQKKILGSCLYFPEDRFFYQSSLLVHCDLRILENYLKHPSREPDYRNGRSHRDFLTTLWLEGYTVPIDNLKKDLERTLDDNLRTVA